MRPHAQSRNDGKNHSSRSTRRRYGGVVHDNARHTTRFTVVGNHLAQHENLSLVAIGLAVHIQSRAAQWLKESMRRGLNSGATHER
ncbi:hypothetical protein AQF52_3973 [Streptomyces venezuelae]|nr:hypothetical protein AQF52_3973 [Streptomyces venezuelae]CUM40006.1 FIG01121960: hypothetical protein [Streptomyces venezuelae]